MKLFLSFNLSWLLYAIGNIIPFGFGEFILYYSFSLQRWGNLKDGPWTYKWSPTENTLHDMAVYCEQQTSKLIKNGDTGDWIEYTCVDNNVTNELLDDITECHEIAKHSLLYTRMPECWEFGRIEKILSRWTNVTR